MPTYDYKCEACGHTWEQFQSMTAAPIKRCPSCGKAKAKRLIGTGAGLIFKGSGFYITDYRDAGYKEKAKAESGAGTTSSEAKSDSSKSDKSESSTDSAASSAATESKPAATEKPAAKKNSKK